jgi:branched-chain amino acid transport system substrate-binding protein
MAPAALLRATVLERPVADHNNQCPPEPGMKQKKVYQFAVGVLMSFDIGIATAQDKVSGAVVKIGVLTDLSGLYSDIAGQGSVVAVKMAVEDFGGKVLGHPIQVVTADHQNKADVAAGKAREWFDTQEVDMITDLVNSSTALLVVEIGRQKNRLVIVNGAASTKLTNENCSPISINYSQIFRRS